jgi:hypothetical protein
VVYSTHPYLMKTHFIVATIVVALAALGFFFMGPQAQAPTTPPAPEEAPGTTQVEARVGVRIDPLGVGIEVQSVLEDSRCPVDVQCVWAGTVRLATILYTDMGDGSAPQDFTLGEPITTETHELELIDVRPPARAGESIAPEEYVFVFEVRERNFDYLD